MNEAIAIIVPIIIAAFAIIFVGICCCCCCCLLPLGRLLCPNYFYKNKQYATSAVLLNDTNASTSYFSINEQEESEIPVVEAYLVPPLVASKQHHQHNSISSSSTHYYGVESNHPSSTTTSAAAEVETSSTQGKFKDIWAAILFLINVGVVFYLAAQSYSHYADDLKAKVHSTTTQEENAFTSNTLCAVVGFIALMVVIASTLCSAGLYILIHNASRIIDWVNWFNIILCGTLTIVNLLTLQLIGAIIFAVLTMANYWYYYRIQDRIPFASAVIETACTAVKANFMGILMISYMGLLCQMLWVMLWGVAFYGIVQANNDHQPASGDDDSGSPSGGVWFLTILSVYWGIQVFHYIVSVTVGGVVATWWFQPGHSSPVVASLFRATTTSFGSICFGSLIIAFIQTCREILRGIKNQRDRRRERNAALEIFICIADMMLQCIEGIMVYVNRFAYSYVAAYGYDFIGAGKQVTRLFERRGWTAIINDNLIINAFTVYTMTLALVSGIVGVGAIAEIYVLGGLQLSAGVLVGGGVGGFIIGWIVANMMVSCLDSGVSMVFVCFAEDDNTLRTNHSEVYDKLAGSWERFNPGSLRWTSASVETGNPLVQARVIETTPIHHINTTNSHSGYQVKQSSQSTPPPPMNPYYSHHDSRGNW